jgi:hypothetical protein
MNLLSQTHTLLGQAGTSSGQRPPFAIVRDGRDALVHVRDVRTGACLGCIEVGLFEMVRMLIRAEAETPARSERQEAGR